MQFQHTFEEIQPALGTFEAKGFDGFTGLATLEADDDYSGGAYGFIVTELELEGNVKDHYPDKMTLTINARSDAGMA